MKIRVADKAEDALEALLAAAPVGLGLLDADARYLHVNDALASYLGQEREALLGRRPGEIGGEAGRRTEALVRRALTTGQPCSRSVSGLDGEGRRDTVVARPVWSSSGELEGAALAILEADPQLVAEATTDPVTGLANHRTLQERLRGEVERARRHGRALALALIDLDDFKAINDTFGHQAGDQVLLGVAVLLKESVRASDVLARIGGDEFALLMPETDAAAARRVAERAHAAVGAASVGEGHRATISVGVCGLEDAADADELLRCADRALYWAKSHGRDGVWRYSREDFDELQSPEHNERLARGQVLAAVRALARAVDSKDGSTRHHAERVSELTARLAEALDWRAERIALLREAALLHDVGKVGVPDAILFKPGPLSDSERAIVQGHAALGAQIAGEVLAPEQTAWLRSHHERHDGAGYPDGLAGDAIPPGARILALVDSWDDMTTQRPYRAALTPEEALAEVRRCRGSQFAPEVVDAFASPTFVRYARILETEQHARAVNERKRGGEPEAHLEIACECGRRECEQPVAVRSEELEAVRRHQRRFFVLPGHEIPDVERVVSRSDRFLVVEKVV